MLIGKFKLGRYHAIIEKQMEDDTYQYETDFSSESDLQESVRAIMHFVVNQETVGICTEKPMKIKDMKVYKGKVAIDKLISLTNNMPGGNDYEKE